ncbi:MAG TPA: PASTA domain-containing protein, partial [Thermodesulfobacteriota bacterium]|nr:PASTA domain-containing protein [Thermodesulfobacteriota bacterium]
PADAPKIALLVIVDEPQGNNYGGVVAAPVFKAIMEKVLPYLNVIPKGTVVVKSDLDSTPRKEASGNQPFINGIKVGKAMEMVVMPDLTGLSMRNALSRIEGKGLVVKVSGNGKVVEQVPRAGAVIEKGDICFLKFRSQS